MSRLHQSRKNMIERIAQRDGWQCAYCGVEFKGRNDKRISLDHFHPRALGGGNGIRNLRLACFPCNTAKANAHPRSYRGLRMGLDGPESVWSRT